jgi:cell division protein FtsI (penicillin-binding protein 3)
VFPIYDPKYIIFVSIDNPKGGKFTTTGGAVSAPIAHDIIEKMIPIFNLLPDEAKCHFE